MASRGSLRPLTEELAREILSAAPAGKGWPLYLTVESAAEPDGGTDLVLCYLIFVRAGGMMLAIPKSDFVHATIQDSEASSEGAPEFSTVVVDMESSRGRRLGSSEVELVDLPWAFAPMFLVSSKIGLLRGGSYIGFEIEGQPVRPVRDSLQDLATSWIAGTMEEDTTQSNSSRRSSGYSGSSARESTSSHRRVGETASRKSGFCSASQSAKQFHRTSYIEGPRIVSRSSSKPVVFSRVDQVATFGRNPSTSSRQCGGSSSGTFKTSSLSRSDPCRGGEGSRRTWSGGSDDGCGTPSCHGIFRSTGPDFGDAVATEQVDDGTPPGASTDRSGPRCLKRRGQRVRQQQQRGQRMFGQRSIPQGSQRPTSSGYGGSDKCSSRVGVGRQSLRSNFDEEVHRAQDSLGRSQTSQLLGSDVCRRLVSSPSVGQHRTSGDHGTDVDFHRTSSHRCRQVSTCLASDNSPRAPLAPFGEAEVGSGPATFLETLPPFMGECKFGISERSGLRGKPQSIDRKACKEFSCRPGRRGSKAEKTTKENKRSREERGFHVRSGVASVASGGIVCGSRTFEGASPTQNLQSSPLDGERINVVIPQPV